MPKLIFVGIKIFCYTKGKLIMKKGFTLLELLIVVVILGVLALIAAPALLNAADTAKAGAVKANVSAAASTVTSKFALKTIETTDEIITAVVTQLNTNNKNPFTGLAGPFVAGDTAAIGVVTLENGNTDPATITIRGYGKTSGILLITKTINSP